MANYYSPTVVQPRIPVQDLTALERLLLGKIFEIAEKDELLCLTSRDGPCAIVCLDRRELYDALDDPACFGSAAHRETVEQLGDVSRTEGDVELDCSSDGWTAILQDVVSRSDSLDHLAVVTSWTCDKMRLDGFGGAVDLITAAEIRGSNTQDILARFIAEAVEAGEMGPLG